MLLKCELVAIVTSSDDMTRCVVVEANNIFALFPDQDNSDEKCTRMFAQSLATSSKEGSSLCVFLSS